MEQISEELLDNILKEIVYCCYKNCSFTENRDKTIVETKIKIKQKGYIKQSREDEIRNILNKPYLIYKTNKKVDKYLKLFIQYISLQKELIKILDNKELK